MSMSMSMSMSQSTGGLQHALTAASGLHAEAALLEPSIRAVYVREITEAGALFAYTDPDNSPVGGFLQQERRIALAEQVNRAILSTCHLLSFHLFSPFRSHISHPVLHSLIPMMSGQSHTYTRIPGPLNSESSRTILKKDNIDIRPLTA
jgi:hypothetical protein